MRDYKITCYVQGVCRGLTPPTEGVQASEKAAAGCYPFHLRRPTNRGRNLDLGSSVKQNLTIGTILGRVTLFLVVEVLFGLPISYDMN